MNFFDNFFGVTMASPDITLAQRLVFAALSLILACLSARPVLKKDFDLRHIIFWFPVSLVALGFSLFPSALVGMSLALGFHVPANAIMSLSIMALFYVCFLQSLSLGRAKSDVRRLTQELALLSERLGRLERK